MRRQTRRGRSAKTLNVSS